MTQPDWDDDRLDAAFHARFDRPAPTDLAHDVHVRIAGTSPARFGALRPKPAWAAAIAAVVVVAVAGTALIGLGGLGRTGASPLPSDAATSDGGPSAIPTEQALPGTVFERLPIIGVTDAIAIRDAGIDDREIAVQGWLTLARPRNCGIVPLEQPISPVQLRCPDDHTWLTEDREEGESPTGPALNPMLGWLDVASFGQASTPVNTVAAGHFDDRRAETCPRDEIDACRDRFVVDAVTHVHGVEVPRSPVHETAASPAWNSSDIDAIIANEAPDSPVMSMTVVDGSTGLRIVEPSLGAGQQGLMDQPILWIVRVLESDRVVTYIVIDGSDAIYEINPENEAILVGGTPPRPGASASPVAWPPAGSRVVALTSEVGADQPPVQVAVVDRSGRLDGMSEKGTVDPATRTLDRRLEAYAEPGVSPGRVHLAWVGGICDSRITVTIAENLRTIFFDMGPLVDCDSIGIGRELVLDFSGLVDVPEIELVDVTGKPPSSVDPPSYAVDCGPLEHDACLAKAAEIAAATPDKRIVSLTFTDECGSYRANFSDDTGSGATVECVGVPGPGYTLDCGPLGRDTCETKAAEIVAANLGRSPPRRVVSIVFESLCGSFTAIYDDGTGSGADIDCIASPAPS